MRHALQARLIALAAAALATGGVSGSLADDGHNGRDGAPIRHVVVIFQENITFDHYFATYPTAANRAGELSFYARPQAPAVRGLAGYLLTKNATGTSRSGSTAPRHAGKTLAAAVIREACDSDVARSRSSCAVRSREPAPRARK